MAISSPISALAQYMAGEFDNREQAIAEPIWYVHLRMWQRPVALFTEDSVTLFAEQASITKLEQPYRQRLMRIQAHPGAPDASIQIQYYSFKDPIAISGAGQEPSRLKAISFDQIDRLPGCQLVVAVRSLDSGTYQFAATPAPGSRCYFNYQGETREVALGFEASPDAFLSYDKGVALDTGKALWGAIMGPYRFQKRLDFAHEIGL